MLQYLTVMFCMCMITIQAVELEQIDLSTLSGKKIGYYIGSFDPLHLGHEQLVHTILDKKLCDYVLVYPAWGGDEYKNRVDVSVRLEMLFAAFKDHPKVIVTKMAPGALQTTLTEENPDQKIGEKPTVKSLIPRVEYIGIIGSDTALSTVSDQRKLAVFMRGVKIAEKYKAHTIGVTIALPVSSFIVGKRDGDCLDALENKIDDRPIIHVIETPYHTSSSTQIRKKLQSGESIDELVSDSVLQIINKYKFLYV